MTILFDLAQLLRKYKYVNKFETSTKNPARVQERILFRLIRNNKQTEFGKKYNFNKISSIKDFQKNVPISKYKDLKKYISKLKKGENNILNSYKTNFFTVSSGTTGAQKFIPINNLFIKDHKRGWDTWMYYSFKDHPKIFDGKILAMVSPKIEGHTKSKIPYGSMSGLTYQSEPKIIKNFYAIPYEVFRIKDYDAKDYTILRLAIEKDITFLSTPNPSTILLLCRLAGKFKDEIIKDIEEGTLSKNHKIEEKIREKIEKQLKPNPMQAEKLRKIIKRKKFYPRYYWPNLALIGCWKEGSMPLYIRQLSKYFGRTSIRDIGLLASEGRVTIPIKDKGGEGILAINNAFFEFIKEDDINKKNPEIYLCSELKKDENYFIILTNSSGLYRYNLNDLVKVKSYYNKTPILEFLHKGEHITSITGEKLTEWQVVTAVRIASRKINIPITAFTAAIKWGSTPYYELLAEISKKLPEKKYSAFIKEFDSRLCKLNKEYASKRKSFRLKHSKLKIVKKGSYDDYIRYKAKKGAHAAQIKLPCLVSKLGFEKRFEIIKEVKIDEDQKI